MIRSFRDKHTKRLFEEGKCYPKWQAFENVAKRKLDMLDAAVVLTDLRAPPNNKLEALKDDRVGQHSIRINDQWRVCFRWPRGSDGPEEVEIADYH